MAKLVTKDKGTENIKNKYFYIKLMAKINKQLIVVMI